MALEDMTDAQYRDYRLCMFVRGLRDFAQGRINVPRLAALYDMAIAAGVEASLLDSQWRRQVRRLRLIDYAV